MDVQSLGFRTDLALLLLDGSVVEDRGAFLVVRTPENPTFFGGNFLLLPVAPHSAAEVDHWLGVFGEEFPGAAHARFGIDQPRVAADALEPLRQAGLQTELSVAMTAGEVRPPPHPATHAEIRALAGDEDWAQQVALSLAGEDDPFVTREFIELKTDSYRRTVEAGHGGWWGGFVEGRLVASLGIYRAGTDLARYQDVKTHPEHRGRGLAGSLVHAAGRDAFERLGARTLVMVADPEYVAIRVYRSAGFEATESHAEATLLPPGD